MRRKTSVPGIVVGALLLFTGLIPVLVLQGPVANCNVGFQSSSGPLSPSSASQCLGLELASATLIVIAVLGGLIVMIMLLREARSSTRGGSTGPGGRDTRPALSEDAISPARE
ncbi:MAG: hypothetical protein WA761_09555 [Thermoplasmata archaeon]